MFDIYLYDENGDFLQTMHKKFSSPQHYKAAAMQAVAEGYSVKVIDQDGVVVYTLDAVL